jgi:hypothetical protein
MTTETPPLPAARRGEEIRLAGLCGFLAFFTFNAGWVAGDAAQPRAFHPADHDISDLGALTGNSPWLYNQLAANVSGLLVILLGIGLWRAQTPGRRGWVGVLGTAAVVLAGLGTFLDGIFRLDCQAIDDGCVNDSWHSHAHKIESAGTAAAIFLMLFLLPLVLRRLGVVRWQPLLAAVPLLLAANIVFSLLGDGAATRAGTVVVFLALAYAGLQLLQRSRKDERNENPRASGGFRWAVLGSNQ